MLENWTYLSVLQFINLYIKYNKFFCDLWIFLKKSDFFTLFLCRFFLRLTTPFCSPQCQ